VLGAGSGVRVGVRGGRIPPRPHLLPLLPERIQSRPLPPVEVVDMRQELQQGNRSIFSRSLQDALQQLQEREQQESYLSTGEDTVRLFLAAAVVM